MLGMTKCAEWLRKAFHFKNEMDDTVNCEQKGITMKINLSAIRHAAGRSTDNLAYRILGALILALCVQTASATLIEYELTPTGGNNYRYEYTVTNDGSLGAGVALEWFAILFDPALYDETSLTIVTANPPAADWDELILGSGLLIDAAYDVFALGGGIADGDSVSGFAVEFTWLGAGMPSAQPFEIYDPVSFSVIETGVTAAPEPGTLALLFLATLAAAAIRRKRQDVAAFSRYACSR